jgi:hypothetical protein
VVPPRSDRIARVPPYSRTNARITRTGLSPAAARLSRRFRLSLMCHWPDPLSLATTSGVSVDVLSSRYLDVSVPWVCLKPLILFGGLIPSLDNRKSKTSSRSRSRSFLVEPQNQRSWSSGYRRWVSPFGNPRIKASSQLPTAYRSVARPSSPLSAKASTEHP